MKLNLRRLVRSLTCGRACESPHGDCCSNCNYMREVELYNGLRMAVCDGPSGGACSRRARSMTLAKITNR